jgi:hypothetical protein
MNRHLAENQWGRGVPENISLPTLDCIMSESAQSQSFSCTTNTVANRFQPEALQ